MSGRWLRIVASMASLLAALPVTCAESGRAVDLSGGGSYRPTPGGRVNPLDPLLTQGH